MANASNWLIFRFRRFSDSILDHALHRRPANLLPGTGHWPTAPQGVHRSLESGVVVPWRNRDRLRRRLVQRGSLLQHHHRMGQLL
jgi:hypothetical protein